MITQVLKSEQGFSALVTADDAGVMLRDRLPGHVRGIQQCVMLAAMTKEKLVEFFEGRVAEGEESAMHFLGTVTDFEAWARDLADLASAITARVLCAASHAFDMPADPPAGGDPAGEEWAAALAEHDRQHARFDALGNDFTDDAINQVAADFSPARDMLIGTPAPDLPALLRKFEIMWRPEDQMRGNPDEMDVREFYKDLQRLAAAA